MVDAVCCKAGAGKDNVGKDKAGMVRACEVGAATVGACEVAAFKRENFFVSRREELNPLPLGLCKEVRI